MNQNTNSQSEKELNDSSPETQRTLQTTGTWKDFRIPKNTKVIKVSKSSQEKLKFLLTTLHNPKAASPELRKSSTFERSMKIKNTNNTKSQVLVRHIQNKNTSSKRSELSSEFEEKPEYPSNLPKQKHSLVKTERAYNPVNKTRGKVINSLDLLNPATKISTIPKQEEQQQILTNLHDYIDWAVSAIYRIALKGGNIEFNAENVPEIFYEEEIPYVITMLIQTKDQVRFQKICNHFFKKAKNSVRKISIELLHPELYLDAELKYKTPEDIVGLLRLCQELMKTRKDLIFLFKKIIKREDLISKCIEPLMSSPGKKQELVASVMELQFVTEDILTDLALLTKQVPWLRNSFVINQKVF